jgi:Flp pilus assembly protein TadG
MIQRRYFVSPVKEKERGSAMVEFALVAPLLFILSLVAFDSGLYIFSFISVQSAARAAAIRNAGSTESAADQSGACSVVTDHLRGLPAMTAGSCAGAPLVVSSVLCNSLSCGQTSASADGQPATLVTVSYTLPSLFRIPLVGPPTVTLASEMKLRSQE